MNHPRRSGRSIVALLAGFAVVAALSIGVDTILHFTGVFAPPGQPMPDAMWFLPTAYRIVFQVAGCYIAARLAPVRPMQHALGLGVVGLVLSFVGIVMTWNAGPAFGPKWYSLGLVATALPCAWLGGRLFLGRSAEPHTN